MEGQSFRRAEQELALLDSFNCFLSSQRKSPKDRKMADGSTESHHHIIHLCLMLIAIIISSCTFSSVETKTFCSVQLNLVYSNIYYVIFISCHVYLCSLPSIDLTLIMSNG